MFQSPVAPSADRGRRKGVARERFQTIKEFLMQRIIKTATAVFVALGAMISFLPRDGRGRTSPDSGEPQQGIERHFTAVWKLLGNAAAHYEE